MAAAIVLHSPLPASERSGVVRQPEPAATERIEGPGAGCGTDRGVSVSGPRAVEYVDDGMPVSFQQEPAILSPAYRGDVRVHDLLVAGEVPEIVFWLWDPEARISTPERWTRVATTTVGGRLVSVFDLTWTNDTLLRHLRRTIRGFDYPYLFWGSLEVQGSDPPLYRAVHLRLGSTAIDPAPIVRIDDTAQYSSHVVNLVLPDFGDSRLLRGAKDFDERRVARRFYELFADEYESIAIVPARTHLGSFGAFHRNVRNDIRGIGLTMFDTSASYGSTGRLRSVEVFPGARFAANEASTHEILHQWGHYFDWGRLGITQTTDDDQVHTPLLFSGETLVGATLKGTRRVRRTGDAEYEIERSPVPLQQHPLELYAMGFLAPQDVPDVSLFDEQDQFAGDGGLPAPGRPVRGTFRRLSINDVMALHGPRQGPVFTTWRRATVVVSRDRLITSDELSYWNFYAARLEDRGRSGVLSYDGHPSFDEATGGRVDLQTGITPREAAPLDDESPVDEPRFGRLDCRDFAFDTTLPSRFRVREEVRVEGRVTATGERFDNMLLAFWKYGGTAQQQLRFYDAVSASGVFAPRVMFREGEEGTYYALLYLFWPGAPPQEPRCTLSPVIVGKP